MDEGPPKYWPPFARFATWSASWPNPQLLNAIANSGPNFDELLGKSAPAAKAALLMDGSRPQSTIQRETSINQGNLSTPVKRLKESKLPRAMENSHNLPSQFRPIL